MDTSQKGLQAFYNSWQEPVISAFLCYPQEKHTVTEIHEWATSQMELDVSPASISRFLKIQAEAEILNFIEETGRGGTRRLYWSEMTIGEFVMRVRGECLRWVKDATAMYRGHKVPSVVESEKDE